MKSPTWCSRQKNSFVFPPLPQTKQCRNVKSGFWIFYLVGLLHFNFIHHFVCQGLPVVFEVARTLERKDDRAFRLKKIEDVVILHGGVGTAAHRFVAVDS